MPACVCVCRHSGTYFHGYGDPGWPMKACLLQTLLCALISALCVSCPAVRGVMGGHRGWDDSMGEKMNVWVKVQWKVEHKGAMERLLKGLLPWGVTPVKRQQRHRLMLREEAEISFSWDINAFVMLCVSYFFLNMTLSLFCFIVPHCLSFLTTAHSNSITVSITCY